MNYFNYFSYKTGPLFFPFMRFYFKSVGKDLYKIDQFTFHLRPNTIDFMIAWEVFKVKEYETSDIYVKESDIIVEIGGHIGLYSCYAAKKASRGKVYVYEPNPQNFQILEENIKLNGFTNIISFNLAITSKNGEIDFNLSPTNTGGHSIFQVDSKKTFKVKTITLEDIFSQNKLDHIDLLKVDAEGAEYEIILAASDKILNKVKTIAIEYHDYFPHGHTYFDLVNFLKAKGYKVEVKREFFQKAIKTGIILAMRNDNHKL